MTHVLYRFDGFNLDLAKRELRRGAQIVPLPGRVFECLCHLLAHRDRAVGRDELGLATFARHDVSDAQLGQIILRARRAVGDDGHEQRLIRTIPRFGFRWMAATEEVVEAAPLASGSRVDDGTNDGAANDGPAGDGRTNDNERNADADGAAPSKPTVAGDADEPAVAHKASPRRKPRRWWLLATGMLAGLAILATVVLLERAAPAASPQPRSVLVLPTAVDGPEQAAWARLGLMAFVGERLRRAGLAVVPNENTLVLLAQMDAARPDRARLRRAANVELIVDSRLQRLDGRWRMQLSAVDAQGIHQRAQATHSDMLQAARIAGDRLLAALGHAAPQTETDLGLAERLQRAEAARLASELDTARRILQAAPPAQRDSPQLRYRLARVQTRAGDYAQAMATLDALLPATAASPVFRARLLSARGSVHMRLAQIAKAERDFDAAVRLLDPRRDHAALGSALMYRGVTRSGLGDFDAALADLGQARVQLLRANDTLAVARVDANLGVLELNRGRPAHALEYLQRAVGVFESFGAIQELLITRSHVLQVHLMLLQYARAWQVSERSWAMRERAGDPGQRLTIYLDRAEVLIRRGRFEQAQALLDDPAVAARSTTINERRRAFVQVELAWQRGDAADALALADAVLAGWVEQAWDSTRGWVLLRRQQAALVTGAAPLPLSQLGGEAAAVNPAADASVPELIARAITLRVGGHEPAADAHYLAALSVAEQRGVPAEISTAVAVYVPWLIARGRLAEAGALVGRVAPWADRDFDCALLQVRLYRALGQRSLWASALSTARAIAGERQVPAELTADA